MKYPDANDLQQLRDAFAEAEGIMVFGPDEGGAWETERTMGIGYRGWLNHARGIEPARERSYPGLSGTAVDELERTFGMPYAWRMSLDQWPELPQPTWAEALGTDEGAAFSAADMA